MTMTKILRMITVMIVFNCKMASSSKYTEQGCINKIEILNHVAFTNPLNITFTNFTTCQFRCLNENSCIAFYYDQGMCHHYWQLFKLVDNQNGNVYLKCLACDDGWVYYQGLCYRLSANCSKIGAVSARFFGLDSTLMMIVQMFNTTFYVREIVNRNGTSVYDTYKVAFPFVTNTNEECFYASENLPLINANCSLGLDEICEKDGQSKYEASKIVTTDAINSLVSTMETNSPRLEQTKSSTHSTTYSSKMTSTEMTNSTISEFPFNGITTQIPEISTKDAQNKSKESILVGIQQMNPNADPSQMKQILNDLTPYMTNLTYQETQLVINGTENLVTMAIRDNHSESFYPDLLQGVAHLTDNVPFNNEDLKFSLSDSMLKITNQILILGKKEQEFNFSSPNFGLAGIKTNPENLDGFNLKTEFAEAKIPDSLKETGRTVYFKMISYKDFILKPDQENRSQSSSVYISMEDGQNNPVPNLDPERTYSLVLKCESLRTKNWDSTNDMNDQMIAYKIPLTKSGLSLVELSSTEIVVWGKTNATPTKYDYDFYYSAHAQDELFENFVEIPNIKIEKHANILRLLIHNKDPQSFLYLLVDSKAPPKNRLQKRQGYSSSLKMRSVAIHSLRNRNSLKIHSKNEFQAFDIQNTFVDENYNVILKTNLFGTFTSVISYVTPQALNFDEIFVDFNKKVLNNPYVLIVLLVIILFYFILAVWVRRLDQKDLISWQYLPLSDNDCSDPYFYLMRVYTGLRSSRTMTAVPYFILKGKKGITDIRILDDKTRQNLRNGTVSNFLVRTDQHLGNLLSLRIWHDNGGSCPKWFLSRIDVKDIKTGQWYSFPCHEWLAFDKGNGTIIHQLESHSNESDNFFTTIKNRIHVGFFDDHLYVSVIKRPQSSNFTRLQRLSSLTAVLYLSLITSAMYYNPDEKVPSRALKLGPFIMTSKEIAVGIISSAIMVIPTAIIIGLFKWRRMKGEESENFENSSTFIERLKRFRLPWWSIYPAYFLVFLSIGASAYFTFIYSIVWGKQLALQWLLSVIVNVVLSILFIQPLKIGIVALFLSYFYPASIFLADDGNDVEILDLVESSDKPEPNLKIFPPPNMFEEQWRQKKRRMKLDQKLSKIFQQFIYRIFFLIILYFLIANERINTKFRQNNAIERQLHLKKLKQNRGIEDIWNWIESFALPVIYPLKKANNQLMLIDEQNYLADQSNKRLGAVRFRQIRTEKGWAKNIELSIRNRTKDKIIESAFRYTSDVDSGEYFNQRGILADYQNGGYIVDINKRYLKTKRILSELRHLKWIDENSRCLFINVATYNANTGLYMLTIIQMERLSVGGIQARIKAFSFKLYPFVGIWDYFILLIMIIFTCLTVGRIIQISIRLIKVPRRISLLNWSFAISLVNILSSLLVIFGFIVRIVQLLTLRDNLVAHPDKYVSADTLIMLDYIYLAGLCGCIIVATLSLLEPMTFNYHLFLMKNSIIVSMPSLLSFSIFLLLILSAFAFSLYVTLCSNSMHFKDLRTVYLTLFRIFLLMGKFHETFQLDEPFTHVVFLAYGFTVSIILLNVCVSIINDSFVYIRDLQLDFGSKYKFDQGLNERFWHRMRIFFGRRNQENPQNVYLMEQESKGCADIKKVLLKMEWIFCKVISDYEKEDIHSVFNKSIILTKSEEELNRRCLIRAKRSQGRRKKEHK